MERFFDDEEKETDKKENRAKDFRIFLEQKPENDKNGDYPQWCDGASMY